MVNPDVVDFSINASVLPVFDPEKFVIAERLDRLLFLVLLHEVVCQI